MVLVGRDSAEIILRSSHCQVFRLTIVCVDAYMDIPGQSEGGLLNKNFLHYSSFFLFLSPFLLLFNEKKKTLLAQSLKSLPCDANLSSLAPSQRCWLCACLISWLLIAGCVSLSIMRLSFTNVLEMDIRTSRQRALSPCLVIQGWVRHRQPAFIYKPFLSRLLGLEECFFRAFGKSRFSIQCFIL